MVNESAVFGFSLVGVMAGLSVLIYGVTLNNGEELNEIMLAGGVVVLAAFGVFTLGVARLEEPDGGGH
jgi:hypothetical protein